MYVEKHTVSVTTDSNGDGTGYTPVVSGRILQVQYVKAGSGNFADGVDFVLTGEDTGQVIWDEDNVNASAIRAPRQATHDTVGVASLYAAGGEPVEDYVYLASERVKIVVANGGNAKSGTFYITLG